MSPNDDTPSVRPALILLRRLLKFAAWNCRLLIHWALSEPKSLSIRDGKSGPGEPNQASRQTEFGVGVPPVVPTAGCRIDGHSWIARLCKAPYVNRSELRKITTCHMLFCWYKGVGTEKGKPVEKRGRKATDLREASYDSGVARHSSPPVLTGACSQLAIPIRNLLPTLALPIQSLQTQHLVRV